MMLFGSQKSETPHVSEVTKVDNAEDRRERAFSELSGAQPAFTAVQRVPAEGGCFKNVADVENAFPTYTSGGQG